VKTLGSTIPASVAEKGRTIHANAKGFDAVLPLGDFKSAEDARGGWVDF
jgi:hypothetical protein